MKTVKTKEDLAAILDIVRSEGKTIGLVPTMGALHAGHASLISRSISENDVTAISIFVNPTQFNDKKDLDTYPRDLETDCQLIENLGGETVVFAPSAEEMYPEPDTRTFSYPPIDTTMEGPRRPGHFNGVCQIVSKLFEATKPNRAYFGEKDFQQIAVIRAMVEDKKYPLEIVPCPIQREESGLALSSRNALLSANEKQIAVNISRTLKDSVILAKTLSVNEVKTHVINHLNNTEGLEVEYFEIVDGKSLESIHDWCESEDIVGCITVYCGARPVRLIDNIRYKG